MPITIPVPGPNLPISPGANFQWRTDVVDLPSTDNLLRVTIANDADGIHTMMGAVLQTGSQLSGTVPFFTDTAVQWSVGEYAAKAGDPVNVVFSLESPTLGQQDTGNVPMVWAPESGQALVTQIHTPSQGSGLTPIQAQEAHEAWAATWPKNFTDATTLVPMSPEPTGDPVSAFLPFPTLGVLVRIVRVPPELTPTTPDGDYWVSSLAVVRVFRGSDLWLRIPVHTSSKICMFESGQLILGLADAWFTEWLLDLSVQVTCHPGVVADCFLMRFP